jgi:hypothetical protein
VKNNQNFIVFLYEKTKFFAIKKIKKRGSDGISCCTNNG